jgi:hypothetical protein
MMAATSSASPELQRGVPPTSDAPHAPPLTLEAVVAPKLRAYEEQLLVELAAGLFREFAQRDGVPRAEIARLLADYPPSAVHLVFSRYDAAGAGVLGARAFLALVRYLNFGNGFCDACFAPIGERERGFMCVECRASGYILCARCFPQRGAFHPGGGIAHRFLPAAEMLELMHPSGREDALPRGVGVLLRAHLTARLAAMDPAGRGFVSRDEFRAHQRAQGCAESYTEFLLALDGGGDRISKRRLLLLAAGQHLLRQCDECGALQFAGGGQVLSCLECVADYDVCAACWLASRCRHEHCHFGTAEPFQLRFAGLHYRHAHADLWALAVGNYELWSRYEPFLRHRLAGLARVHPIFSTLFIACI